jgi:hypothetical protein
MLHVLTMHMVACAGHELAVVQAVPPSHDGPLSFPLSVLVDESPAPLSVIVDPSPVDESIVEESPFDESPIEESCVPESEPPSLPGIDESMTATSAPPSVLASSPPPPPPFPLLPEQPTSNMAPAKTVARETDRRRIRPSYQRAASL